jgi:nitrate reductase beta subunit
VIEQARADGVPEAWLEAARHSPVWKMAMEWKVAFPLHPEYRTLPMVWYVPPLSPINAAASAGKISAHNGMPDVRSLRIPVKYLANLLTAGKEEPVIDALERMLAMRAYMRAKTVRGVIEEPIAAGVGLSGAQIEEMYRIMAIANYEDRFVIPSGHREDAEDMYDERGGCGFPSAMAVRGNIANQPVRRPGPQETANPDGGVLMRHTLLILSHVLRYPHRNCNRPRPNFWRCSN